MWPVPAWPANERDENSDDVDPKIVVDLAVDDGQGASAAGAAAADGDVDSESILSDIGDA